MIKNAWGRAIAPAGTAGHVSWSAEIVAAGVGAVVAITYAMSYAALLFAPPLQHLLPMGIALAIASAAVGALWLGWRSQLPFAVAGPDGNTTSILATMAATLGASGGFAAAGPAILWVVLLTTVLCALAFLALGFCRLGSAVRYVPYPVIGGFLASTGWLICVGALRIIAELPPQGLLAVPLATFAKPVILAAFAFAVVLLFVFRKRRGPLVLPLMLIGAAVATHVGVRLAGLDAEQASDRGWLFDTVLRPMWSSPFTQNVSMVDWTALAREWPDMIAVTAVGVITVLLSASALEVKSRGDISIDKELREHGWLNLASAASGGYLSLVSVARSSVIADTGARTRLAPVLCGALCVAALFGASSVLQWVPRVVLSGFLLYLGLAILREWVVDVRRYIGLVDWAVIVLILVTTATIGFTVAVFAGVIVSTLNFALSYSRVGVVQHDIDATSVRSSVQRPPAQRAALLRHGSAIRVIVLRGLIFFGTASSLLDRVRGFLAPDAGIPGRVLVLDFSHAASADSSARFTFAKIAQLAAKAGVTLVVSGLGPATKPAVLQGIPDATVARSLDDALEAAEDRLLRAHALDPGAAHEPIGPWLERELGEAHAATLLPLLQRREIAAGETLLRHGQPSDATLYFIERGRFDVTVSGQAQGRRLASLMAGTIVGEMALYDDAQRSATVTAHDAGVVWALKRDVLEHLHEDAGEAAMRVHALVVRTLAERVRQANAAAAALQHGAH
ncbi:SLC26A/SulP transporter family protein [Ramlibacter sp.]|uniref:SLC26A/SulP transporter family protein n=1 Tax=Ramlibacter sp. TaxID=1917967 RepID=UPI003D11BE20